MFAAAHSQDKDTFTQHFPLDSGSCAQLDYMVISKKVQSVQELVLNHNNKEFACAPALQFSSEVFHLRLGQSSRNTPGEEG